MKYFEISERDLKVLMRTLGEARTILEYYYKKEAVVAPRLPNGDLATHHDSPITVWMRKAQVTSNDISGELSYLTSEYFDRRGHCANYQGPERRGMY